MTTSQDVFDFWFGRLSPDGTVSSEASGRWYRKDLVFDREIRERFLDLHLSILRGEQEAWLLEASASLAYVIVLDQFSRNMFRDTRLAFASDPVALTAALASIERGHDRELAGEVRAFMYLPLMHSEDLALQDRCVACFERLCSESSGALQARIENNLKFALRHRDVVAQYGRFPHRNRVLQRASTPAELAYLSEPGAGF